MVSVMRLYVYAEKCIFGVFLEVCRVDYVGGSSIDSKERMIREVCKNIGELKMEYKSGNSNRWATDTLDDIYGRFISAIASLPDAAAKWSVSLCDRYYSTLVTSLQDKIECDNFSMTSLN